MIILSIYKFSGTKSVGMAEKMITSLKQLPSLSAYLASKGVTESTPKSEIDRFKKAHRKIYQRLYDQQRRKKKKRLQQDVSKAQYQQFKKEAKRHKEKSPSAFVLKCALAYLNQHYIPHDPELIRQYIIQVRRIGNNINQVVHSLHYQKDYSNKSAYQQIKKQVDTLQEAVHEHMNKSLPIGQELMRLFTENPKTVEYFEKFLAEWKAKHS